MVAKFVSTLKSSKERILTGIALISFIISILYFNNIYLMWGVLGVFYIISLYEVSKILILKEMKIILALGVVIWLGVLFIWDIFDLLAIIGITIASLLAYNQRVEYKLFLPIIYPTIPFIYIFRLYDVFGIESIAWLIIVVALCDTSAYFVGKNIGKTKFSITSPNKTLEGVWGGIIISTLAGVLYASLWIDISIFKALFISFAVAISSIFGDLFESLLKRKFDIKDSGSIFPGHGGVLDRVDGYLFSSIILYILSKAIL